jgi:hypothetical protein
MELNARNLPPRKVTANDGQQAKECQSKVKEIEQIL